MARGSDKQLRYEVTIDWGRLTARARDARPLWLLRRYQSGHIESVEISKSDILIGEERLQEVRAKLAGMVADHANRCIATNDLYPEIIVT